MGRDGINREDTCLTPATTSLRTGLVWWPRCLGCVIQMEEQWTIKVVSQCSCIASSHVVMDDENIPYTVLKINLEVVCVIQPTCKGQLVLWDLFWSSLVPHCLYSWNALCAMTRMETASSLQKAEATDATFCLLPSWSKQEVVNSSSAALWNWYCLSLRISKNTGKLPALPREPHPPGLFAHCLPNA